MRELSLFTGAGGGLLGTLLLGWTPIGYVEYDDYCQRIIAQRIADGILPEAPIFGDVRAFISEGYAESYQGLVDVVTAGFPCQPFSVAGKRAGADDERNMWPATIECIRMVRPRFCLLENVAGLVTSGYFGAILGDLAESGYDCRWRILSAAELGAPHKRDRLWIVAHDSRTGAWRLPVRQGESRQASTDVDGSSEDVADTDGGRGERTQQEIRTGGHVAELGGKTMAHADSQRQQKQRRGITDGPQHSATKCDGQNVSHAEHARDGWRQQPEESCENPRNIHYPSWWQSEPELGRLADEFSDWLDFA